jgi:capsular polysaccharide transport system permease protein
MPLQMRRSFSGAFWVQKNAIGAVMMREFISRWGRRDLGFAWVFCEALVFGFPVLTVWHFVRPAYDNGLPMLPFLWTGYMSVMMFRHVTNTAVQAIQFNRGLFFHRRITPLDIFIGRCGLQMLGECGATVFSFTVFYMIGVLQLPDNFSLMLAGYAYMSWWVLSMSLILVAVTARSETAVHLWQPFGYLYLFWGGFLISAQWIPQKIRDIAMWVDPPLQCYEIIRRGYFGSLYLAYYYPAWLTFLLAMLTLLGLWLLRDVRRYIEWG